MSVIDALSRQLYNMPNHRKKTSRAPWEQEQESESDLKWIWRIVILFCRVITSLVSPLTPIFGPRTNLHFKTFASRSRRDLTGTSSALLFSQGLLRFSAFLLWSVLFSLLPATGMGFLFHVSADRLDACVTLWCWFYFALVSPHFLFAVAIFLLCFVAMVTSVVFTWLIVLAIKRLSSITHSVFLFSRASIAHKLMLPI